MKFCRKVREGIRPESIFTTRAGFKWSPHRSKAAKVLPKNSRDHLEPDAGRHPPPPHTISICVPRRTFPDVPIRGYSCEHLQIDCRYHAACQTCCEVIGHKSTRNDGAVHPRASPHDKPKQLTEGLILCSLAVRQPVPASVLQHSAK